MKKVLAVTLAIIMVLSAFSMCALAANEEKVPVVLLQGYSGPDLAYADENGDPIFVDGEVQLAWPLNYDNLGSDIADLLADVALNDADLTTEIANTLREYLAPIGMNDDGTSKNNLVPYPSGAAATRASTLIENGMEEYIPESVVAEMAMEEVGAENVFGFTYDWRKSQVDYARALDEYIQEVKEITGSDKVDLYGLSHGGQYGTTYLCLYGWRGDVRRAMFGNPATLGNTLCGSLFTGEYLDIPLDDVVEFIEHGFDYEKNWEWIFKLITADDLVAGANIVVNDSDLWKGIISIPSLWDFVPADYFDEALDYTGLNLIDNQKLYIDTVAYHELIEDNDNVATILKTLQNNGMQIGYIAGYGYTSINGKYNSDILIDTHLSTGSYCALADEVFDSDYTQANTNCNNPNHYHISPEFNIDASTGILPDSTWYVRDQGHGMIMHDEYTKALVHDFLWGNIKNVYSSKAYPQFNLSQNDGEVVYMRFDNTSVGYHSSDDTALVIKNMSTESTMIIWSVKADNADISFKYSAGMAVSKGDVVSLAITDSDFDSYPTPITVTITYSLLNTQMTSTTESFCFTPMSDAEMDTFAHLSNSTAVLPDVTDSGNDGSDDADGGNSGNGGSGDSGDVSGNGNGENGNGGSQGSDGNGNAGDAIIPPTSSGKLTSVAIVAVLTGAVVTATGVVIKKRDEDEE